MAQESSTHSHGQINGLLVQCILTPVGLRGPHSIARMLAFAAIATICFVGVSQIYAQTTAVTQEDLEQTKQQAQQLEAQGQIAQAIALHDQFIADAGAEPSPLVDEARGELIALLSKTALRSRISIISQALIDKSNGGGEVAEDLLGMALIWQARFKIENSEFAEARGLLEQTVELAVASRPEVAYEAEYMLGELCETEAKAFQEDRGPLHEEARVHYVNALQWAETANLAQDLQNRAIAKVAWFMRHLDSTEKALAWLRNSIQAPANLSEADLQVVRLIGEYSRDKREAWYEFIVDPVNLADPLDPEMLAEFSQPAPAAQSVNVNKLAARLCLLGELRRDQRWYEEAIVTYGQAESAAESTLERARVLSDFVEVYKRILDEQRPRTFSGSLPEPYRSTLLEALAVARRAEAAWLTVILYEGTAEQAVEGIKAAVELYRKLRNNGDALALAQTILTQLPENAHPYVQLTAKQMHVMALGWTGSNLAASDAALDLDLEYSSSIDITVLESWAYTLLRASIFCARAQCPLSGRGFLDKVENRSANWRTDDYLANEVANHRGFIDTGFY